MAFVADEAGYLHRAKHTSDVGESPVPYPFTGCDVCQSLPEVLTAEATELDDQDFEICQVCSDSDSDDTYYEVEFEDGDEDKDGDDFLAKPSHFSDPII